jgi:hypothetical protein
VNKSRVLFLDFDGTLHPDYVYVNKDHVPFLRLPEAHPMKAGTLFMWAPVLVGLLDQVPHFDIVLSTSWALQFGLESTKAYLSEPLSNRVVDMTWSDPNVLWRHARSDIIRSQEITEYAQNEGISHWVALDDKPQTRAPVQGLFEQADWIQCDPDVGISATDVQEQLLKALSKS